jgi:ribosomal 30S subunit maturation factor RimM
MNGERSWTEEIRTTGEELLGKIKELLHEGNIRRVIIKNEEGKTLIEVPLTVGVVGAVVAPTAAAIGAIAALVSDCTIIVEKQEE